MLLGYNLLTVWGTRLFYSTQGVPAAPADRQPIHWSSAGWAETAELDILLENLTPWESTLNSANPDFQTQYPHTTGATAALLSLLENGVKEN